MVEMNPTVRNVDAEALTDVVRRALRSETIEITDWECARLSYAAINPASGGLYRFAGSGKEGARLRSWSVILKIACLPDGDGAYESSHHSHWNYWKREFPAYQSGLLDALPPGLTAPRCFGAAALIALRWGLSLPMILGMALDESRHAWIEQTFGLPAAPWIHRWGDASDFLLDQADHARRFVG